MPTATRTRTVYKLAWLDTYQVSESDGWQYMPDELPDPQTARASAELVSIKYPGVTFGVFRVTEKLEATYEH